MNHHEVLDAGVSDRRQLPAKADVVDAALARRRVKRVDLADAIRLRIDKGGVQPARRVARKQ